jgi:serine/threonine-protein kinase
LAEAPEEHPNVSFAIKFYIRGKALEKPGTIEALRHNAEQLQRVEGKFLTRPHRVLDLRFFRGGWPPLAVVTYLIEPSLQRVLDDLAEQHERLSPELVMSWARHLFEAVEALHGGHRLVHRNIKPSNILLRLPKGRLYCGGESLAGAEALLSDLITAYPIGGDPLWELADDGWKAPEVFETGLFESGMFATARRGTPEEDLYSLGLVLKRLAGSAAGDLTSLREIADGLTNPDPQRRVAAKHDLRTLLFPAEHSPESGGESAIICSLSHPLTAPEPGVRVRGEAGACGGTGWAEREGIPGYAILRELGSGGMGVVYEARDLALDRLVAIKILRPGLSDARAAERFRIEATALARLSHPNIVQAYRNGSVDDRPYIVFELVLGTSLTRLVKDRGALPADEAARLAEPLAGALAYLHANGILHRDLKPANVLLTADGTPKIIDFGLAKLLDEDPELTPTGQVMGTPMFMAPEVLRGASLADERTDVYSLGATLYYLLTGHHILEPKTHEHLRHLIEEQAPRPLREWNPDIPPALEAICLKCLAKAPDARYASAAQLADALREFREGATGPAEPSPRDAPKRITVQITFSGSEQQQAFVEALAKMGIKNVTMKAVDPG